jgi:protein-tyrosine phosphatase
MLDFHNHLMPGVDDGAADIAESRLALSVMSGQGVTTVITTPHIRASQTHRSEDLYRYLTKLDTAFAELRELGKNEFPNLRIERGVEMALDVPSPMLIDARMHLAGTPFVLVEFPFMSIPPNSTMPLREIRATGVTPIIAHPERYSNMAGNLELIENWKEVGACVQINAGSLVGQYGATAKRLVWEILEQGWADYMCSDYHARGRCSLKAAGAALIERGGEMQFRDLTDTNPERMIQGLAPIPVSPLEEVQLKFWKKVFR